VCLCVCVSVFLSVCYYCFFSDGHIYLFSSLAARVFNKLTRYSLKCTKIFRYERQILKNALKQRSLIPILGRAYALLPTSHTITPTKNPWPRLRRMVEGEGSHVYAEQIETWLLQTSNKKWYEAAWLNSAISDSFEWPLYLNIWRDASSRPCLVQIRRLRSRVKVQRHRRKNATEVVGTTSTEGFSSASRWSFATDNYVPAI